MRAPSALVALAVLAVSAVPAAAEPTCAAEVGRRAAEQLVERCLAVSPATHPPCNVENSCALIQSEIARGCALLGNESDSCEAE